MTKRIVCPECNGLKAKIVMKGGKPKMLPCKPCKGTGKIHVEAGSKAARTKVTESGRRGGKVKALHDRDVKRALRDGVTKKAKRAVAVIDDDDEDSDDDDEDDAPIRPASQKSGPVQVTTRNLETGNDVIGKMTPEQREAKETIEERAAFFGCLGKVTAIRKGPVITLYEFAPAKTTRIKRLINLQEDLALALSAEAVMVRRVPGREVMGIEISNADSERQNVAFRASLASVQKAKVAGMELPLNLGTDPFGDPVVDDLAIMPHLLIAGSTGSGKSVSLNAIISSLLTVCSPAELEFYMIDPKGVELTHYNGIPHMKQPMVTSPLYARDMLERLVEEMRSRLVLLARQSVRDIREYSERGKKAVPAFAPMPRIVCVIDELGDLMMQDRRAFTRLIAEISGMARATGIHMICATHRPSVDVLSGRVKVNFPARMAFKVTSPVDSRTIVHRKGAEALLGRGDMLYLSPTRSACIRIHAPWVPLNDVKAIANTLRDIEAKRIEAEQVQRIADEARRQKELDKARTGTSFVTEPSRTIKQGEEESTPITFGWTAVTPAKNHGTR